MNLHTFTVDAGGGHRETRHAYFDREARRFVCEWVDNTDTAQREHDRVAGSGDLRTLQVLAGLPEDVCARLARDAAQVEPAAGMPPFDVVGTSVLVCQDDVPVMLGTVTAADEDGLSVLAATDLTGKREHVLSWATPGQHLTFSDD